MRPTPSKKALRTGDARALAMARKRFMKVHGRVFFILGIMQYFWYRNDKLREALRQHLPAIPTFSA